MLATSMYLDGKKLRYIRVTSGETYRSLSEKSGVSTATIYNLENTERNERFRPTTLKKLADALGVPATELVVEE